MFLASPRASSSKAFSKAAVASPMSIMATTSASEIQSGDDTDIALCRKLLVCERSSQANSLCYAWRKLSICALERGRHRRLEREAVNNQSMHNVAPNQH